MAKRKSESRHMPPNRAERRGRELALKLLTVLLAMLLAVFSTGAAADHISPRRVTTTDARVAKTDNQVMVLEGLVASQEVLLNVYRCQLRRDTHIVPGGCPAPVPTGYRIPVYSCVPSGIPVDDEDLQRVVDRLNWEVGGFFARESSGLATVTFTAGQVLWPPDAELGRETLATLDRVRANKGSLTRRDVRETSACYRAARQDVGSDLLLMILPAPWPDRGTDGLGVAWYGGPVIVDGVAFGSADHHGRLATVAHELGHALFGWDHTNTGGCRYEWSVMSSDQSCQPFTRYDIDIALATFEVVCSQRASVGWPCDGG